MVRLARRAARRIMQLRAQGTVADRKGDGSPVTRADREAEAIIVAGLRESMAKRRFRDLPIVAEEAVSRGSPPPIGEAFVLVDPLDGTREFVGGGTDFTVNIAIVERGEPTAGVVLQPAGNVLYAADARGAWVERDGAARERLACAPWRRGQRLTIVASRSHRTPATERWIGSVEREWGAGPGTSAIAAIGSSLKLCLLAEGRAHLYPRIGRTMEWDIAAGHAVLRRAGGHVFALTGEALSYGRARGGGIDGKDAPFANPPFIASSAHFPKPEA